MFSELEVSIYSRDQLYGLLDFHRGGLKKISYTPRLYHLHRRFLPVKRLSAQLGRGGKMLKIEKQLFKFFVLTMRASFLLYRSKSLSKYSYDFTFHNSFLSLRGLSGEALIPHYILLWKLLEVEPLFKISLFKYRRRAPKPRYTFLSPNKRIFVTFRWAAAYLRMRNRSLKKSISFFRAFQHIFFSEIHSYSLIKLKQESYRAFMLQEQNK